MNPYYQDDLVTIYHGDNRDILAEVGAFDLIFTSPPYNTKVMPWTPLGHWTDGQAKGGGGKWNGSDGRGGVGYDEHDDAMPWPEYEAWQRTVLTDLYDNHLTPAGAIFYNHKPRQAGERAWLPTALIPEHLPLRQIVTWARAGGMNYAPTHYVPTTEWLMVIARPAFRLKSKAASGLGDLWRVPQEPSPHPAPFPVGLPARAIETTAPMAVLDPFVGSGTTLVAAKKAGIRAVGIELSERYCEMAARRCSQEVLGLSA